MSYFPQPPPPPAVQPRPIGVTMIAALGLLLGIGCCLYTVVLVVIRLRQGQPVVLINSAAGLLIGVGSISLYMGLWNMARWAWGIHIVLHSGSAISAYYVFSHIPQMRVQVTHYLPDPLANSLNNGLQRSAQIIFVVSVLIVVYLVLKHHAFQIGVRDERPEWER